MTLVTHKDIEIAAEQTLYGPKEESLPFNLPASLPEKEASHLRRLRLLDEGFTTQAPQVKTENPVISNKF